MISNINIYHWMWKRKIAVDVHFKIIYIQMPTPWFFCLKTNHLHHIALNECIEESVYFYLIGLFVEMYDGAVWLVLLVLPHFWSHFIAYFVVFVVMFLLFSSLFSIFDYLRRHRCFMFHRRLIYFCIIVRMYNLNNRQWNF